MTLFHKGDPEDFWLFVSNFNVNIEALGLLLPGTNMKFLCTLVRGEELRQFDTFSAEVESTTPEYLMSIILGFGAHFFPVNAISKQNHAMRRGMRKPGGLKLRHYSSCLIDVNKYLDVFPVSKSSDKICVTELNDFFSNSMLNSYINK